MPARVRGAGNHPGHTISYSLQFQRCALRPILLPTWVLFAACSAGDTAEPSITTDASDTAIVSGDDDDSTGTVPVDPLGPGLVGRLVGADGAALAHFDVQACSSVFCLTGATGADGEFAFQVDPGTRIALKTHEVLSNPARAAVLIPVEVPEGPAVDLGAVFVPDLPEGVPLGSERSDPQVLSVGDGLELTLNAADLVAPFGVFLHEVGAARLPDNYLPAYPAIGDEGVLHVYAMVPFSTASTSPIGVRVPTELPSGASARVRTIDPLDGTLSEPIELVSDGSALATAPGTGVSELTHLVITQP